MREPRWGRPPSHGRPITHRTPKHRQTLPLLALPRPLRASCLRRGPIVHRICHEPTSYPSCGNVVIPSREGFPRLRIGQSLRSLASCLVCIGNLNTLFLCREAYRRTGELSSARAFVLNGGVKARISEVRSLVTWFHTLRKPHL